MGWSTLGLEAGGWWGWQVGRGVALATLGPVVRALASEQEGCPRQLRPSQTDHRVSKEIPKSVRLLL